MKFEFNKYYNVLFLASLCIILFIASILAVGMIIFIKNNHPIKINKKLGFFILTIIVCVFFFSIAFFSLKHGIHLINEKENNNIESIGVINKITKTYGNNKYTYDGHTVFASYIHIENGKYYIMYIGNLQVGEKVTFEYLPKSKAGGTEAIYDLVSYLIGKNF